MLDGILTNHPLRNPSSIAGKTHSPNSSPVSGPPIIMRLEEQDHLISAVGSTLDELRKRLSPVLSPDMSEAKQEDGSRNYPGINGVLMKNNEILSRIHLDLIDILNRLEV